MIDLNALRTANANRWSVAKPTRDFDAVARRLIAPVAKARYQSVSAKTGVPWAVIAVIHERECSQDWSRSLAQGDLWNRASVHVPAGRGPFKSWEEAAVDALVDCAPHAAGNTDWSAGGALTKLEEYNGLGYASRGRPSPYIWSGTDQYKAGKYVRDGVYDPDAVDSQLGCAGLLKAMTVLDPGAALERKGTSSTAPPTSQTAVPLRRTSLSQPSLTNPSQGSIGAFVASIFAVIFKRR
jgi:lysozyme family protein